MTSEISKIPLLRAWLVVRTGLLVVVLLGALAMATSKTLSLLGGVTCDNRMLQVATSPDGSHKAHVFRRGCGGAAGFSTQVSVLPASAGHPEGAGNAFITDADEVLVRWRSPDRLLITHPARATVSLSEPRVSGVSVSYE